MNYKLYRCKFIKETKEYIIAKDVFNDDRYYIKRTTDTERFKVGFDNAFYAIKICSGIIFKKNILEVINFESIMKETDVDLTK